MLAHTGYPTLALLHASFAHITAREIAVLAFPLWSCSQCQLTYKHLKCILGPGMGGPLKVYVRVGPGVFGEGPHASATAYVHSEFVVVLRCQSPEAGTGVRKAGKT